MKINTKGNFAAVNQRVKCLDPNVAASRGEQIQKEFKISLIQRTDY